MINLRSVALPLVLLLSALQVGAERLNLQVTITAGTPVRLAPMSTKADRLMIQSAAGNTGLIYIMDGVAPSKTCNASDASQLSGEIGPGDATHPGGTYTDPPGANGISPPEYDDLANMCVDGTHSGDKVIVTFYHRN